MAAEILESSSAGFAAAANAVLQSRRPSGRESDSVAWQQHLQQRILELAAALRVGEPALFTGRIAWLRRAAAARNADDAEILEALASLRTALEAELPEFVSASVRSIVDLAVEDGKRPVESEARAFDPATPEGKLALDYIAACLDPAHADPIDLIMGALNDGLSPVDAYCRILLPAQKEVGLLWHVGDFSVSEERMVTETTRRVMSLIAARYAPSNPQGSTMLAASVAGNAHDIGLRTVSDLFLLAGWRCIFLGANVPADDIARTVREYDVHLAVLTATLTPQLGSLANAIAEIKRQSPETRVLVGGIAFEGSGDIWRQIGADAFAARVDDAVAAGTRLLGESIKRG
jgi:methanogenic corrinoid protein MtbC1